MSDTLSLFEVEADRAALRGPLVRVRMTVAYDGTPFHGFAAQPGLRTVAGTLREALTKVLRHPVELTGAGRTDRGVHAWGQVVSFDAEAARFDEASLMRILNKLCGPSIAVRDVAEAEPDFDARFSARSRRYRYTVVNRLVPDPFRWATSWQVPEPLDLGALRLACDPLIGEHDFSSFCRRPRPDSRQNGAEIALIRRVLAADWIAEDDDVLRFEIEASSFCHQMVRSVVGLMVDVGRGRRRAGDVLAVIAARDRGSVTSIAPPRGLCLWEVNY